MTIDFHSTGVNVRRATEKDAAAIAALYDAVRVSEKNYKEKIDPHSKNSFGKTGGMFCALSKEDVVLEMQTGKSDFFLATFQNDPRLLDILWLSEDNPGIEQPEDWLQGLPAGKVCFARDFIANRIPDISNRLPHTPLTALPGALVYALAFQTMRTRGYHYALSEVYHLDACQDETGDHALSMINASFEKIKHIGARTLGENAAKQVKPYPRDPASALSFTIVPRVICFDLGLAIRLLEEMITDVL